MNSFKKKMKSKIKLYSNKEYLDGYIKNEFLTEDGIADIYLKIDSMDDLFDSRTISQQRELKHEIYDFIEEKISMLDNDVEIHFHFVGLNLEAKEQEKVKHLIKEHYAIELYKTQKEFIRCRNKILSLILLGIITLVGYALLYFYTEFDFFLEVFGFLFSFSLWVGGESYIYDFSDIKDVREAVTQTLLMNIIFDEKKEF